MFGGLFSAVTGLLGGGSSKSSTSTSTSTTSSTDDRDIAATDNARVTQYLPSATTADNINIESLDGQVALASIAAVLDTTMGAVTALKDNSNQAFGLVNEQARSGSERLAQSTISGVVMAVIAAAIAYAIANRKGK